MALKNMLIEEMVQVSASWVDPASPARQALSSIALLGSLLPEIDGAHAAILAVQPTPDDPRRAAITEQAQTIDITHDTLARGLHWLLSGASLLGSGSDDLIGLRDELFTDGLGPAIQRTFRGQAGYAALLRKRLTPELKAKLEKIRLNDTPLRSFVEAWLDAGEKLGALEDEAAQLKKPDSPTLAGQVNQARLGWIRAVNALVNLSELANLTEDQHRLIFGSLDDAESTAERRAARRKPGEVTSSPEAPVATG